MPTSSNVPCVGEKPFSSASTPKTRAPPGFGVAVETPLGWVAVAPVVELGLDPELQAASRPPEAPMAANPTPVAVPRARNERRSIRSGMFPLGKAAGGVRRRPHAWNVAVGVLPLKPASPAPG